MDIYQNWTSHLSTVSTGQTTQTDPRTDPVFPHILLCDAICDVLRQYSTALRPRELSFAGPYYTYTVPYDSASFYVILYVILLIRQLASLSTFAIRTPSDVCLTSTTSLL